MPKRVSAPAPKPAVVRSLIPVFNLIVVVNNNGQSTSR